MKMVWLSIMLYATICTVQLSVMCGDNVSKAIMYIEQGSTGDLIDHLRTYPGITPASTSTNLGKSLVAIARYHADQSIPTKRFLFEDICTFLNDYAELLQQNKLVTVATVDDFLRDYAYAIKNSAFGDVIEFYNKDKPLYIFTNFWRPPNAAKAQWHIEYDGQRWATSEHAFQAAKFKDAAGKITSQEAYDRILQSMQPRDAFGIAREKQYQKNIRKDWHTPVSGGVPVKDLIMRNVVAAKFRQHPELRAILFATGESVLEEASLIDSYWGTGVNKDTGASGENRLGLILGAVRMQLRQEAHKVSAMQELEQLLFLIGAAA